MRDSLDNSWEQRDIMSLLGELPPVFFLLCAVFPQDGDVHITSRLVVAGKVKDSPSDIAAPMTAHLLMRA